MHKKYLPAFGLNLYNRCVLGKTFIHGSSRSIAKNLHESNYCNMTIHESRHFSELCRHTWIFQIYIPWEPTTIIFRGYNPYFRDEHLHVAWFWGPRVSIYIYIPIEFFWYFFCEKAKQIAHIFEIQVCSANWTHPKKQQLNSGFQPPPCLEKNNENHGREQILILGMFTHPTFNRESL